VVVLNVAEIIVINMMVQIGIVVLGGSRSSGRTQMSMELNLLLMEWRRKVGWLELTRCRRH